MENIRTGNLIKKYGMEYLSNLSFVELKAIKGMTKTALKYIVTNSDNKNLMIEYINN